VRDAGHPATRRQHHALEIEAGQRLGQELAHGDFAALADR
jgi:hypothetical protein